MTKNFDISEFEKSETAIKKIDNTIPDEAKENLQALCENVLQPLRDAFGKSIIVTSGYRCSELNKAVGGAKASEHLTGCAADITAADKADNRRLFFLIQRLNLPFNKLIWEKGDDSAPEWLHVSYKKNSNKRQLMRL